MRPDNTKWIILAIVGGVVGALFGPMLGRAMGGFGAILMALFFVGAVGYIVYLLAGNKVGKAASPAALADARALKAPPGQARIYVVRRGFMGGLAGMKVSVDGVAAGQIRMNQFVMAEVAPGTYTVETAMARNGAKPSNSTSSVTVGAGEVAVIRVMLEVHSLHATTVQERLSMAAAPAEIGTAKLVQWTDGPRAAAAGPWQTAGQAG